MGRRVILSASIGREYPVAQESQREWAERVSGDYVLITDPLPEMSPYHSKFFWMADHQSDEIVWLDDDVVVRADAMWPDYDIWGLVPVLDRGRVGPRVEGIRMLTDALPPSYYNAGVMFTRAPSPELREIGQLGLKVPCDPDGNPRKCPEQAALAVHLTEQRGVTNLPGTWNLRWPRAKNSVLPGYMNHFMTHSRPRILTDGVTWRNV